jgi:hypothetical protein
VTPVVKSLHVYPVKSCRGLALQSVRLDARGPLYDRRWMIVDAQGAFLTQREEPRLALVRVTLRPTEIALDAPDMRTLRVPARGGEGARVSVKVWNHQGPGEDAGEAAADWLSQHLGRACRLVRFPDEARRAVSKRHTELDAETAFTDGYPVLLISEASLADLNGRMKTALTMERFRPNVVVTGTEAYAEDTWKRIRVGDVLLDVVKPCARCAITTVDPTTADRGKEPLATLASYRRLGNDVLFGQNAVHHGPGTLRAGDAVEVLETQAPPRFEPSRPA